MSFINLPTTCYELGYTQDYEIYRYSVGFDDLTDVDPLGNTIVTRYGRHLNFECRVKLIDINVTVSPGAEGSHSGDDEVKTGETELDFKIKIFKLIYFFLSVLSSPSSCSSISDISVNSSQLN